MYNIDKFLKVSVEVMAYGCSVSEVIVILLVESMYVAWVQCKRNSPPKVYAYYVLILYHA